MELSTIKRTSSRQGQEDEQNLLEFDGEGGILPELDKNHSTILDSAFNFTNSIVGAGIIGLPYAMGEAGMFLGIILIIGVALLVDYTVVLLVVDGKLSSKTTYPALVRHCFGSKGFWVVSFFQFVMGYGGMCAYTVIMGDSIPSVFNAVLSENSFLRPILTSRNFIIVACTVCVSLPLSLNRDISALAKTSAASIVMIIFIVVAVVFSAASEPAAVKGDPTRAWTIVDSGIFEAIGVISFAFVCHHNTFLIYGSLKKPTINRFEVVSHISTLTSCLLCLMMSIGGHVNFTDKTKANILNNFSTDNGIINICRLLFGMNMFLTFPIESFVCREVIYEVAYKHKYHHSVDINKATTNLVHTTITSILVFSAMFIALSTCDLGFVLELTGGFAATVLAFILPAACFLQLSSGPVFIRRNALPIFTVAFGTLVMVLSTWFSIIKFINKTEEATC